MTAWWNDDEDGAVICRDCADDAVRGGALARKAAILLVVLRVALAAFWWIVP